MKNLDGIRKDIERLSYLSDVYENLKNKINKCSKSEIEDLKSQIGIAKKEMMQISYLIDKNIGTLTN
ncbi:hypothetical protein HOD20_05340 [archaeon]|jgi:hypothetical protein|nr:hypothetical protein [archaeon]MBT4351927.1 hypothetical protein [archaeon]MBT4647476.1 hypothetical protein [archaeon]MBT6822027.1 hypothetical protein [archaeon]MBT7391621.1 hypothetical protein [archaeon]